MQLHKGENKFDYKKVEQMLINESRFIANLFSISAIPERRNLDEEDNEDKPLLKQMKFNALEKANKKPRATSFQELEERLKAITNKKKLTYKEKLAKKGLKNRMKKKSKQDIRNAKLKLERAAKLSTRNDNNQVKVIENTQSNTEIKKPIFNSDNKIVFSKINFTNLGKKKLKKEEKDPEKLLKKLTEEKTKLQELELRGETSKIVQMKEKTAWKNALAKAEGHKVKDDPILLKKSVQKKEQKIRSSKKKWEDRMKGVEKAKDDRQKKRSENIAKRKKAKKIKKLKSASKRGKIIPGF